MNKFIMEILLMIIVFGISIIIHEIAHAYIALLFGDSTARDQGRITLNPISHIDLMWSIIMPALTYIASGGKILFGGAKPVPINPLRFYNRRLGVSLVSAAGPLSNLTLAILAALLLNLLFYFDVNFRLLNYFLLQTIIYNIIIAGLI
mgnify:CR=1 FL=1